MDATYRCWSVGTDLLMHSKVASALGHGWNVVQITAPPGEMHHVDLIVLNGNGVHTEVLSLLALWRGAAPKGVTIMVFTTHEDVQWIAQLKQLGADRVCTNRTLDRTLRKFAGHSESNSTLTHKTPT